MTLDEFVASETNWYSTPHVRYLHVWTTPNNLEIAQVTRETEKAFQLKIVSRALESHNRQPHLFWVPKAAFGVDKESQKEGLITEQDVYGGILPLKPWYIFKMTKEEKRNWHIVHN